MSPSRVHTESNAAMKQQRFSRLLSVWLMRLTKAKQCFARVLFISQFGRFTATQSTILGFFLHSLEKCKLMHHKGKPIKGLKRQIIAAWNCQARSHPLLLLVLLLLQPPTQEVTCKYYASWACDTQACDCCLHDKMCNRSQSAWCLHPRQLDGSVSVRHKGFKSSTKQSASLCWEIISCELIQLKPHFINTCKHMNRFGIKLLLTSVRSAHAPRFPSLDF